jgi:hypothetical protein
MSVIALIFRPAETASRQNDHAKLAQLSERRELFDQNRGNEQIHPDSPGN